MTLSRRGTTSSNLDSARFRSWAERKRQTGCVVEGFECPWGCARADGRGRGLDDVTPRGSSPAQGSVSIRSCYLARLRC